MNKKEKQLQSEKNRIKSEIEELIDRKPELLEEAARRIAPEFDYEEEARKLSIEEIRELIPDAEVSLARYPKAHYKPKTRIGRFFIGDRHQIVMTLSLVALLCIVGFQVYNWINIYSNKTESRAEIFGEEVEFTLIPGTVKENLEYNKVYYDEDDEVSPALDEEVTEKTHIKVDEVHYVYEDKTEEVKYVSQVILDPSIESGEYKRTKGKDGKGVFTYKTQFVNGKEHNVDRELKRWIEEPVNNTLRLGTARTGHSGEYTIESSFTANCSAYWMGNNCYGAGGGKCVYGTVAVDRHKYPYGTLFWIEGYGFAVANDCGTSIKGDKLDLWMDSYKESCQWGRRHMNTYVLKKVDNTQTDKIMRRD